MRPRGQDAPVNCSLFTAQLNVCGLWSIYSTWSFVYVKSCIHVMQKLELFCRKDLSRAQREYKKKKAQKKASRMKQMEDEREQDKNKWIQFNSKVCSECFHYFALIILRCFGCGYKHNYRSCTE